MKLQRPRPSRISWMTALLAGCLGPAQAQSPPNLADLSLEQLSDIQVTSVGKRVQRLADVPGSVYVISQEDIRRSGAVSLPEALRLAPNLQIARADANRYAITARGFNSVLANKMLVLIDGRTAYSPLFSGVFWETLDMLLEDIERIEVLSGAGGTLYGSNAVNGVINIITRSAAETTGALLKAGGGNQERLLAGRWGAGAESAMPWRVYAKRFDSDATPTAGGAAVPDASKRQQVGFRADRARDRDHFTLQGDLYQLRADQLPSERRVTGANLLGRWSRDDGQGARTQVQAYFDRSERKLPSSVDDRLDTWDLELQQASKPGPRHDLLWGAGYRWQSDQLVNLVPAALQVLPPDRKLKLWNVFAQDEYAVIPRLRLIAGLKAEHNSYSGLEWLPTAKLAWQPDNMHLLWASASRAVRVPSRVDRDLTVTGVLSRGPDFDSEVAKVFELGWRGQPRSTLSYSVTLFHHRFDRLRSMDLAPGGPVFGNSYEGKLSGVEAWGHWRIADQWRLQAGWTHQRLHLQTRPGSVVAPGGESQLANDPRNRGRLSIGWDLAANMELDLLVRHVGALPAPVVPSYTAVDLRWGWRPQPALELSLAVRNLTDARHPEWGAPANRAEIPRSFFLKAVWRL